MRLEDFFARHNKAALAFSGGVDSAYLLYAGLKYGADIRPYYVKSAFQPEFELRDALRLTRELGVEPAIIPLDVTSCEAVASNPPERCYHCKGLIMGAIMERAAADGYSLIIDGSNASDELEDRPGMRALAERGILSPLRQCGLGKGEIRRLSKEAGLFTWDKPAYACLATRLAAGDRITAEKLMKIERGEEALFALGFRDFRLRLRGGGALLQVTAAQLPTAAERLGEIRCLLREYFPHVELDMQGRKESL